MPDISWIPKKEAELHKKLIKDFNDRMFNILVWGKKSKYYKEPEEKDFVKLAWVMIDGKKEMLGVHNKTMAGYEMEEKCPTFKIPLVPKEYDSFVRWCTTFDI